MRNQLAEVQTAWTIDPTNTTGVATDDGPGTSVTPLLTFSEHARRLAFANIAQATTTTVLGSQQSTDKAVYTYQVPGGTGDMAFVGTPTVIYTSTVTSYAAAAVTTATADDCELGDTAVPGGSFTAAGALAKGVFIKRTNGTVIYAAVLKDLGSTTARLAQPINLANVSQLPAFTVGDTYQCLQLPQIVSIRITEAASLAGTVFTNFDFRQTSGSAIYTAWYKACYFSSWSALTSGVQLFQACCIDSGSTTVNDSSGGNSTATGCAFKGTGATTYSIYGVWDLEGNTVSLQGCHLQIAAGIVNMTYAAVYDWTGAGSLNGALSTDTGGRIHLLGPLSGKGSSSKFFCARQGTQIVSTIGFASGTGYPAGATSDASPIQAGGTASASQITLDVNMNGVFVTQ